MKYYSYQNLPGVALGPLRIAILRSPYPVSDPLSTLTRGDESGNSGFPEDAPDWTPRTENGVKGERRPWHFQPRTCTQAGDLAILDLHPGYPVPNEDVAEIATFSSERKMQWFRKTTFQWVDGLFSDIHRTHDEGFWCIGTTEMVATSGDIGSIIMCGKQVVGFVSKIWPDGTGFEIARLTELHRTVGIEIPQVPPEPTVEPPKPPGPTMLPVIMTVRPTAWEYMVVSELGHVSAMGLDELGRDGWEICGVHHNSSGDVTAYLKRPLMDQKGTK